jgi:hypothetical protein
VRGKRTGVRAGVDDDRAGGSADHQCSTYFAADDARDRDLHGASRHHGGPSADYGHNHLCAATNHHQFNDDDNYDGNTHDDDHCRSNPGSL